MPVSPLLLIILDKASVTYTYYALRQLPFTVLMDVTVNAKKDILITRPV